MARALQFENGISGDQGRAKLNGHVRLDCCARGRAGPPSYYRAMRRYPGRDRRRRFPASRLKTEGNCEGDTVRQAQGMDGRGGRVVAGSGEKRVGGTVKNQGALLENHYPRGARSL